MHDHLGLDASAALPSLFLQLNFKKMLYVQFPEIYTIINARRQKFELHADGTRVWLCNWPQIE